MSGVYPGIYRVLGFTGDGNVARLETPQGEKLATLLRMVKERRRPDVGDFLQICADGSQYVHFGGPEPIAGGTC